MKRTHILFLTAILLTALAGCGKKTTLAIPFEAAAVDSVEIYSYAVPGAAQKRVVTEAGDIAELYTMFSELEVSDKKREPAAGETVTSFRINLSDGSDYEIIYTAQAVKSGRLQIPAQQLDYFTPADIGACWEHFDAYEPAAAGQGELPSYR